MGDHGFKVSQPGFDVKTATPSQLVFSSKYQTLKVKQQGSGVITHDGGRSVTIPHNLGYAPMFLVHSQIDPVYAAAYGSSSDYFISPFYYPAEGCHLDRDVTAWVDATNLYIKVQPEFGWYYYYTQCAGENYAYRTPIINLGTSVFIVGESAAGEDRWRDGAFRFTGVTLNKNESIREAHLQMYVAQKTGSIVKMEIRGIDEDNTIPFHEGTNPFDRDQTSSSEITETDTEAPNTFTIGVKGIVEEIIARNGWSSGNALAIICKDNGSLNATMATDYSLDCGLYCSRSDLKILKSNTLLNYKYTIYLNEVNP